MRIVCPSSSSQSLLGPRKQLAKRNNEGRATTPSRKKTRTRETKERKAEESKKKKEKKEKKLQTNRNEKSVKIHQANVCTLKTIYVGNIIPGTPVEKINETFSKFGPVEGTIIRCSRGVAVARVSMDLDSLGVNDRHYATVTYAKPESVRKAYIAFNAPDGMFKGSDLIVTLSPADLPEATEVIKEHLQATKRKQWLPEPPSRVRQPPIIREDTDRFKDYRKDRLVIGNYSFSKEVM